MFKVRALFWLSTERWKRTSIAKSREWRKSRGAGVYGQSGVASSSPVLVFVKWENDGWGPEDYGKQLIGCSKWEGKTLVGYKESMAFLTLILVAMWGDAENGWWEVIPSKSGTVGDMLATVGYMGEDGRCARSNGARNAKEHRDWGSQLVWVEAVSHIFETHIGHGSNQTCWSLIVGWGAEERTGYLPLMTSCFLVWATGGMLVPFAKMVLEGKTYTRQALSSRCSHQETQVEMPREGWMWGPRWSGDEKEAVGETGSSHPCWFPWSCPVLVQTGSCLLRTWIQQVHSLFLLWGSKNANRCSF